eukprot:1123711-Pyramimonas_sp.AAC.1
MKSALMSSLMSGSVDAPETSQASRSSDSERRTRAQTSRAKRTARGLAEAERHPASAIAGA